MPKFRITTETDRLLDCSVEPLDFPHAEVAIEDAQVALAEMARERLPNGKAADFAVKVEDESGSPIFVAELHFKAKTREDLAREEAEADAAAREIASCIGVGRR